MPTKGQIDSAIRDFSGNIIPWKKRNKVASNASTRARRALNPERRRKENKSYRERNPFGTAVIVAKGRAKILCVISTLTKEEWRSVVEAHNFICHICKEQVSLEIGSPNRLSLDHIIPMSRGGGNVKENVLPAHRRCNQGRHDMTLEEFDIWVDKVYLSRRSGHGKKA